MCEFGTSDLNVSQCVYDPFPFSYQGDQPPGLIGVHVDDIIFAGVRILEKSASRMAASFQSNKTTYFPFSFAGETLRTSGHGTDGRATEVPILAQFLANIHRYGGIMLPSIPNTQPKLEQRNHFVVANLEYTNKQGFWSSLTCSARE